jgi:hypothetical protein
MLSRIRIISNTCDLFGILLSPWNSPGFHAKKHNIGTAIAAFHRPILARRKAGTIVRVGKGHNVVGVPVRRRPIEAGTSNPTPAIPVATALFDVQFTMTLLTPKHLIPA